jgi:hypothetical protein
VTFLITSEKRLVFSLWRPKFIRLISSGIEAKIASHHVLSFIENVHITEQKKLWTGRSLFKHTSLSGVQLKRVIIEATPRRSSSETLSLVAMWVCTSGQGMSAINGVRALCERVAPYPPVGR